MRVRSYPEILLAFNTGQLDPDDEAARKEMLTALPFSVIVVEGGHMELDNLEKWISLHFGQQAVIYLYYEKTGYDFGFAEYFFGDEESLFKTAAAVPRIYTLYPHSLTPDQAWKSMGYNQEELADANDPTAIIFPS